MEDLVKFLAQSLVEEPEKVRVYLKETRSADIYKLQVATDDIGRVIGKNGRVANALRTVLRAANYDDDRNVLLEID